MNRFWLQILLVFGVLLWSMAPVFSFAFQMGQRDASWIQICGADGQIKTISGQEQDQEKPHQKRSSCVFCSVVVSGKYAMLPDLVVASFFLNQVSQNDLNHNHYTFLPVHRYQAGLSAPLRAPPFFS